MPTITLHIQLLSEKDIKHRLTSVSRGASYEEILDTIAKDFPYVDKEASRTAFDYGNGHLMLQLPQQELTIAQRDWMHMYCPQNLYIDTFSVAPGGWDVDNDEPDEATLAVIQDLLDVQVEQHEGVFILSGGVSEGFPYVTNLVEPLGALGLRFDSDLNYALYQFERGTNDVPDQVVLTEEMVDKLCAIRLRHLVDVKRSQQE